MPVADRKPVSERYAPPMAPVQGVEARLAASGYLSSLLAPGFRDAVLNRLRDGMSAMARAGLAMYRQCRDTQYVLGRNEPWMATAPRPPVDPEDAMALSPRLLTFPPHMRLMYGTAVNAAAEKVLIIGGGSGAGLALAQALLADGAEVTIVGRSADRLSDARKRFARTDRLRTMVADISQEDQVARLFDECGPLHHIVTTVANVQDAYQCLSSLDIAVARRIIDAKFTAPLLLAKYGTPCLARHGSITLMSGIAVRRPLARGSVVAALNGALEALAYALAAELGPIRVNIVSPGWADSPGWPFLAPNDTTAARRANAQASMPGNARTPASNGIATRALLDQAGQPMDVADAIRFLMRNGLVTGTVLHVDSGRRLQ